MDKSGASGCGDTVGGVVGVGGMGEGCSAVGVSGTAVGGCTVTDSDVWGIASVAARLGTAVCAASLLLPQAVNIGKIVNNKRKTPID